MTTIQQSSPTRGLRAGVGRTDITPALGRAMMGYADAARKSESIRDRLHATALCLEDDGRLAVLISADVICVDQETTAAIRKGVQDQTGIDGSLVTVHPIQTHSGPCMQNTWGWGDRDDEYVFGSMIPAPVEAVVTAWKTRVPVRIGIGVTRSDAGINRRNPNADGNLVMSQYPIGLHDPNMTVIRFESA